MGHDSNVTPLRADPSFVDMDRKQERSYSLTRAIAASISRNWSQAGLEQECSDFIAQRVGRPARGFYCPVEGFRTKEHRAQMDVANDTAALVETVVSADNFIEAIRPRMVTGRAGIRSISGLVGDTRFPVRTTGATVDWMDNETTAVTPTDSVYNEGTGAGNTLRTATPKTVSAASTYSRLTLLQANPDIEQLVRDDIANGIANELDRVVLGGSGADGEPTGVCRSTDTNSVALTTNGTVPTISHILSVNSAFMAANGTFENAAVVTDPAVSALMRLTSAGVGGDTGTGVFANLGMQQLAYYHGCPVYVTNNCPTDLERGTGENLNTMILAQWDTVLLCDWGGVDIVVDPITNAESGSVTLWGSKSVDVVFSQPDLVVWVDAWIA